MPYTINLPPSLFNTPLLVAGRPEYLLGTYSAKTSPTLLNITNISASGNSVTINATITAGKVPTTAQLLTVQNASNSGINAVGATVTSVTGFNTGDNSTGTIVYTVTGVGTIGSVAGSGQVVMPVAEVADVLQNGSSISVASPFNDPRVSGARTITAQVSFPVLPTSATVVLSGSDDNVNFYSVGTVITVTAGVATGGFLQVQEDAARFHRFDITNYVGAGSPPSGGSIVGKIVA